MPGTTPQRSPEPPKTGAVPPRAPTQPPRAGSKTATTAVQTARVSGAPAVRMPTPGTTPPAAPPAPVAAQVQPGEVDLSSGEIVLPAAITEATKPSQRIEVPARLPGLAEGTLRLQRSGDAWNSVGSDGLLLRHPALAGIAGQVPTILVVTVRKSKVSGYVGVGSPGPARSSKQALFHALARAPELVGWAGLSKIRLPSVKNELTDGALRVSAENLGFTVGGFLSGSGSATLDSAALSFEGSAKIAIPGGSGGELAIKKAPSGELSGKLDILVKVGGVSGTVIAALEHGMVHIQGTVAYAGDRMSGSVTLIATDEKTARDITTQKPEGGQLPALPAPSDKPGKRAFCGFGEVAFSITDWLTGSAKVIVNSQGQATIIGEIAPPKEFILFEQKDWEKPLFNVEARAGYGIPVVGQIFVFASAALKAKASVGPGKLYNIKLQGVYSTDPRVTQELSLQASLNISAFAGLIVRAEGGAGLTLLGHDLKAGVGIDATAGVRGYVEATPKIGMRKAPGQKAQYFIEGHMEIAAQPFLGLGGDLFVSVDSPWWSPLPDKKWTWPLFSLEYPLPGEFGIGADVKYVLGQKGWPDVKFGDVSFDASKFTTDIMSDNASQGKRGEQKKPGTWKEGQGGKAPGGAKTGGGKGKSQSEGGEDIGPIGEEISFSDGEESHRFWIAEKGADTTPMLASQADKAAAKLSQWEKQLDEPLPDDAKAAQKLLATARKQLDKLDKLADDLAHKKQAAKNARQYYQQHGKKGPRKKPGQAKKDLQKAKQEVRSAQRALGTTLRELAKLMARRKFQNIDKQAAMFGGSDPVSIIADKTQPGLRVAKKKNDEKYLDLATGPLGLGISRAGLNLVQAAGKQTRPIGDKLAKVRIKNGQINKRAYASLKPHSQAAAQVTSGVGKKMRIPNLERARHKKKIEKNKLRTLQFAARPATPGKALYRKQFLAEMRRQLADQQRGLNALTVDEWMSNLARFSMNADVFARLDKTARTAILSELKDRGRAAGVRAKTRITQLQTSIAELRKKKNKNDAELAELEQKLQWLRKARERKKAAREALAELRRAEQEQIQAPRREILKPAYATQDDDDEIKIMELKIIGRQGNERKVRDEIRAQLDKLLLREKSWSRLASEASELAVLHRPDQVAGGYDRFEPLPPLPTRADDEAAWKVYLDALKKMVGPQVVNKQIGEQWKEQIYKKAVPDVRKAVPANEAYPIHLLNFTLQIV